MFRRLAAVLALTVLVCACSEPPTKEREQADAALAEARKAGAAAYAPEELTAAEAALAKYGDAVAQHDYRQALNFALEARDRGYDAARLAGEQKAVVQKQAATLTAETDSLVKAGNARLVATPGPRAAGPAAERLRAAVHAATLALQEAGSLSDKQDYQSVIARLTPANTALKHELASSETGRRGRGAQS